ncbi:MAG TPA: C4-type zinc ribbon domain-containing protein [Vicinamibacterales bacterium]|nr:C4-type zinc ribbon domain-containing protein [Vicinamibacterales bacterium]
MVPDLERLIRLQQIDTFAETARRRIADHPAIIAALDDRLQSADAALVKAKGLQDEGQVARRALEKDLAAIQSRLSKYKDQLMEVKTNKEYQAMQKEIEAAQNEVRRLEDRLLEQMIANDDLAAGVKAAEARLDHEKKAIAAERTRLDQEFAALEKELERVVASREEVAAQLPRPLLDTYETLARNRRGLGLAEARGGLCTACHVRLRPQMFNEIRANNGIHQCESCQRILYFLPSSETPGETDTGAGR